MGLTAALLALGAWESLRLSAARRRLRYVVHVNGTRGKSSVTRLIAAALREAGVPTYSKTTGTLPRVVDPAGRERPVDRRGRANVIEQARAVRDAAASGAHALVVECMALQPSLQALTELKILRSTHSVITNVRPDHLDVMGPTEEDVARALAGTVGSRARVFSAEVLHVPILKAACDDRGAQLTLVGERAVGAVTPEDLSGFRYAEHAENVALALAVCDSLGVERALALRGMWRAAPDPGALTVHHVAFFGRDLVFYNAFAANDPVSTERLWRRALTEQPGVLSIAIFNCRDDRVDRTVQLARAVAAWPAPSWILAMGSGTELFQRCAIRAGVDPDCLVDCGSLGTDEIFERLVELAGTRALLVGMGNIGGQGLELARYFSNRSVPVA